MQSSVVFSVCTKTFISSSQQKSKVILDENHLLYRLRRRFIHRKIYYKEIYQAHIVRINHLFYFASTIFLLLQGLIYFVAFHEAPPLYPVLSFILFLLFFIGIIINEKCLYSVRVKQMEMETEIFLTSKRKEAKALVKAINETLEEQRE